MEPDGDLVWAEIEVENKINTAAWVEVLAK
jgi:hypothetical protein